MEMPSDHLPRTMGDIQICLPHPRWYSLFSHSLPSHTVPVPYGAKHTPPVSNLNPPEQANFMFFEERRLSSKENMFLLYLQLEMARELECHSLLDEDF